MTAYEPCQPPLKVSQPPLKVSQPPLKISQPLPKNLTCKNMFAGITPSSVFLFFGPLRFSKKKFAGGGGVPNVTPLKISQPIFGLAPP